MSPARRIRQKSNMETRRRDPHVLSPLRRDQTRQRGAGPSGILTVKRRLLKMIVSNLQPLEIPEDPNFLGFAEALSSSVAIPTVPVMRSLLPKVYNEEEQKLRHILASADDIVLTCELWSSRPEDSFLTIGCHFVDNLGSLKSFMLKTTSLFGDESADNIQIQLSAVMEDWGVTPKVHAVIRAGMPQLKKVKARWTHIPCFADTLNEVFKVLMRDDDLSSVLRKCQNIVRFFKYDSAAVTELRKLQNKLGVKPEELIMYSGERWLAWLDMLQRLDQQYQVMVMVFNNSKKTELILNETEKENLKKIISALEPLRESISMLKGKGFKTISVMLPVLKTLMEKLEEEKRKKNNVAQKLLTKCKEEFGDINNYKMATATFLDPRYKDQLGDRNRKLALDKITKDLSNGKAQQATKIQNQLYTYMDYPPTPEESNPLSWWRHKGKDMFGDLSKLALKQLGVVSTAVPLERAFSAAGDHFCSRRSAIEPENLNMMLFLNSNWSGDAQH
ncbi:uncharacterized protein si:ch211-152f22.4 [Mugil cephalus]|uniref:uncharacterized protein si:ch211-152f22.4 n=1 Tax=Mugil cephalus TaxID=48193 RepID=UPI001FB75678|nr:uncharacterized protein si:ch211-152f22.4 [Mugil cephalus]XP_047443938.1 uncharacterized protein si:ch211-152f22.4 [Mugil cephalus]